MNGAEDGSFLFPFLSMPAISLLQHDQASTRVKHGEEAARILRPSRKKQNTMDDGRDGRDATEPGEGS